MSSSSDTQPFAEELRVSASFSLHTPSPDLPAPACLLPASHIALTSGQVCTQLGNDQHFFGIAPEQSVCERSSVQLTTPEAVGGPPVADSSIGQCTISVELHANSVVPSSSVATCPAACAAFAPVPATPAHLCPLPGHFSLQHLPAATGRPPGSSAAAAVSPGLPCAPPALALLPLSPVQLSISPSKRRLSFAFGPKLAKRFKLG